MSLASGFPADYLIFMERQVGSQAFKPRLAHGAALLPSASSELHWDTSSACREVLWIYPRRRGVREKRSSTSVHQSGINPAADTTQMLCFGSGLSKVVAAHSSATAQHLLKHWQNFPVLLQANFNGMKTAS